MKKSYQSFLLFIGALVFFGCTDTCETVSSYTYYKPVFMSKAELRDAIQFESSQGINQSGKIYFINDHLLINEPNKGIHIIDNANPENPQNLGFINIPGNFDLAPDHSAVPTIRHRRHHRYIPLIAATCRPDTLRRQFFQTCRDN